MRPKVIDWDGTPRRYVHLKYDGHWTEIHAPVDGKGVRVLTRHPTDITDKMLWHPVVQAVGLRCPAGTVVLGELYVPGGSSANVKTAINNGTVKFMAFALGNMSSTLDLQAVEAQCLSYGIPFAGWRHYRGETADELLRRSPQEGFVLKDGNLDGWAKVKPVHTIDCVVTGHTEGARITRIAGLRVSLWLDGKLVEVATCSGMDDQDRLWWTRCVQRGDHIGRVVEVAYTGTTAPARGTPRLRHPRLVDVREDKDPRECVWPDGWPVGA